MWCFNIAWFFMQQLSNPWRFLLLEDKVINEVNK